MFAHSELSIGRSGDRRPPRLAPDLPLPPRATTPPVRAAEVAPLRSRSELAAPSRRAHLPGRQKPATRRGRPPLPTGGPGGQTPPSAAWLLRERMGELRKQTGRCEMAPAARGKAGCSRWPLRGLCQWLVLWGAQRAQRGRRGKLGFLTHFGVFSVACASSSRALHCFPCPGSAYRAASPLHHPHPPPAPAAAPRHAWLPGACTVNLPVSVTAALSIHLQTFPPQLSHCFTLQHQVHLRAAAIGHAGPHRSRPAGARRRRRCQRGHHASS